MEKENIVQVRTRKIKLKKLLTVQKHILHEWNNSYRYSYNKAISLINLNYKEQSTNFNWIKEKYKDTDIKQGGYEVYSAYELRDLIVPKLVCTRTPWLLRTPKEIRASACFEAKKNLDVCFSNMKNAHINYFDLKFKSKKNNSWTIGIPKSAIKQINSKELSIYVKTMPYTFKLTEQIQEIKHDCLLHFDGIDYFICVPEEKQMKKNTSNKWFVSSDPGSRKFQTLFCPDENEYIKLGEKATYKMYKYLLLLDNLLSNFSKKPSKQLKLRILKLRRKINNYQKELHNKVSNYLCENYKTIYIPKLTKENDIINCKTRKINTKVVRQIAVLGHGKFIETLKTKADLYTNVQVNIITEEYTSQTCIKCKKRTKTTSELFKCNYCNYKLDRDLIGSTNILLKNW
jgi:putative transposase